MHVPGVNAVGINVHEVSAVVDHTASDRAAAAVAVVIPESVQSRVGFAILGTKQNPPRVASVPR